MSRPIRDFTALREVDGYVFSLPEIAIEFRVERLRRERGELVGEPTVACALPGVETPDGVVSVADLNFSSARGPGARQDPAGAIEDARDRLE